jgi:TolB-like protein
MVNNARKGSYLLRILLVIFMLSNSGLIAQVNMWVMSFDNLYNDAEINWLKEGFVDFIIDHYKMNSNVRVYKTEKLDKALLKIRSDARFRETRNLVLSGAYQRKKGEFIVELQLTDLSSWEMLANKTVREKSSDLAQLIMVVNGALDKILDPKITESFPTEQETRPAVEKIDISTDEKLDDVREMTAATKNIGVALEQLLDAYTEKPSIRYDATIPFQKNDITQDAFTNKVKDLIRETHSFEEILNRVLNNPYEINIGEPLIQRLPLEKDKVILSFTVDYQMRIPILQEMMETLKYKNKHEGKEYIEYSYSGNDYIFTSQFVKRVAYGEYRYFPVISLIDENEQALTRLVDSPALLDQVKRFKPMFNIATITVFLSKEFQSIDYELILPLRTIAKISQVSINMMTEEEIIQLTQNKKY